uniref:Uncharacterized protein n=1 Tax=Anguilla anguilla TaxID=7936 RepID=A0A0E9XC58_ANGAN
MGKKHWKSAEGTHDSKPPIHLQQVLWETRNIKAYQKTSVDLITFRRRIQNLLQDGVLMDYQKNKDLAREKCGVDHWKELII